MLKLVKNINKTTKQCDEVFVGTDTAWAITQGFEEHDVEESYDGLWYLSGFAPAAPEPTYEEQRAAAYPADGEQLDMLYHDINEGLLGEAAMESRFYLVRKAVKEEYPKEGK